jgi:uncharacterized protein (DUF952 family)
LIFKIVHAPEWAAVSDAYAGSEKDRADGFLHFSTREQLMGTLARYYIGATDLMLVAVDADALGPALKLEASTGGARYPHLYAPLPLAAVAWVRPIETRDDGGFVLPD